MTIHTNILFSIGFESAVFFVIPLHKAVFCCISNPLLLSWLLQQVFYLKNTNRNQYHLSGGRGVWSVEHPVLLDILLSSPAPCHCPLYSQGSMLQRKGIGILTGCHPWCKLLVTNCPYQEVFSWCFSRSVLLHLAHEEIMSQHPKLKLAFKFGVRENVSYFCTLSILVNFYF